MKQSVFPYRNLVINYLPGEVFSKDTVPRNSILLDGAMKGSFLDIEKGIISFDHHSDYIPRHAQSATCTQVRDAINLGWKFPRRQDDRIWVYINDIDLDTMLSLFLLTQSQISMRISQWVDIAALSDVFGPAYRFDKKSKKIRDFLYYRVLRKHSGNTPRDIIISILEEFRKYTEKQVLTYTVHNRKVKAYTVMEKTALVHPASGLATLLWVVLSDDPIFEEIYAEGADVVVAARCKDGNRFKYTIAKRHDFIPFNIQRCAEIISEHESGWGGASSIIGSPEKGSVLPLHLLIRLIKESVNETPKHKGHLHDNDIVGKV